MELRKEQLEYLEQHFPPTGHEYASEVAGDEHIVALCNAAPALIAAAQERFRNPDWVDDLCESNIRLVEERDKALAEVAVLAAAISMETAAGMPTPAEARTLIDGLSATAKAHLARMAKLEALAEAARKVLAHMPYRAAKMKPMLATALAALDAKEPADG